MNLTAVTSRASAALVAAVAGFASYSHIVAVATRAGEHQAVAVVLPLSIDGLIVVGTMAMIEDKRGGRVPRLSARVALGFGIVATLAANVASAEPTTTARCVAAIPALAFLIAVEVLARSGKPLPAKSSPEPVPAEPVAEPSPEPVAAQPEPVREPVAEPVREPIRRRVTPRTLTAAARVVAAHEKHQSATHERIAELAGVSVATVKRYRPKRITNSSPTGPVATETRVNGTAVEVAAHG